MRSARFIRYVEPLNFRIMKNVYLMKISVVLLAVLCWSFTGVNSNESSKVLTSEDVTDFSSVDNGQSVSSYA